MRVRYTQHALERLTERRISKREVKEALQNGRKVAQPNGTLVCTYKNNKDALVVVCNVKGSNDFEVITAYK